LTLENFVQALRELAEIGHSPDKLLDFLEEGAWRLQVDSRAFVGDALANLEQIVHLVEQGEAPDSLVETFLMEFAYTTAFRPDEPSEALLWDLQEKAAGLSERAWHTPLYIRFVSAVDALLGGATAEEEFLAELEAMDALIAQADSSYEDTSVLPKEVTVESSATDLLLRQGVTEWRTTLREAHESQALEDHDWDLSLLQAERANRLLMALQYYNVELQERVDEPPRAL
jgi:hypothetical protein